MSARWSAGALLLTLSGFASPAGVGAAVADGGNPAADVDTARRGGVLVFEADDNLRPAYVALHKEFRERVVREVGGSLAIYSEGFDVARLGRPGYLDALFEWHCRKYRDRDLRVIVTIGAPALEYATRWRDACAPGTSLVFANVTPQALAKLGRPPASTGLTQASELAESIAIAFDLLPRTKRIAVVGGPADGDYFVREFLASAHARYADRAEILDLTGLPMTTTLQRVASLPPDTIVAFTSLLSDGAGQTYIANDAARMVSAAANAPMFGLATVALGNGTIGGRLISPQKIGRDVAVLTLRVFRGEPPDAIPVRQEEILEYGFDAAQLERWGLADAALPAGSHVINRRPPLWEAYRGTVIGALVAFLLQAALIAALLRERRRRLRVNRELHRLSGELMTSQENERRRVARELHDDVGQRLALLSIEVEQLRRAVVADQRDMDSRLAAVAAQAGEISVDVHNLARDLHPARLETLGLARALRAYADEAERRHGIEIAVVCDEWPARAGNEQALVLYRIAQEAVQNAVKHGRAKRITIELVAGRDSIAMAVTDDGAGFAGEGVFEGIGLIGMRERASLARGTVAVESEPDAGTSIHVVLPWELAPEPDSRRANGETSAKSALGTSGATTTADS